MVTSAGGLPKTEGGRASSAASRPEGKFSFLALSDEQKVNYQGKQSMDVCLIMRDVFGAIKGCIRPWFRAARLSQRPPNFEACLESLLQ